MKVKTTVTKQHLKEWVESLPDEVEFDIEEPRWQMESRMTQFSVPSLAGWQWMAIAGELHIPLDMIDL